MAPRKLTLVSDPVLLLCEGAHDRELLQHLLDQRGIDNVTVCSNYGLSRNHGNSFFGQSLNALINVPGFDRLKAVVIITDSDNSPTDSFALVRKQIEDTTDILGPPIRRYPTPANAGVVMPGQPAMAVLMIPGPDRTGAMETLCLDAARHGSPQLVACVDAFADCAGVNSWKNENNRSKARFRSLVVAGNETDPEISPANLWSDGSGHRIIPLDHAAFDPIADFLRRLIVDIGTPEL